MNLDFKNAAKRWEKVFSFPDNCIWIGVKKLPRFSIIIRESFSNSLSLATINQFDKGSLTQSSTLLGHCWLLKGPPKRDFLDIYLTTFSECVISKTQNLWRLSFFFKYLNIQLDFKNAGKNSENVFCWLNNCMRIGIVKLSLLRTGYFSSAANVLRSSPKISHVNQRDFFQINCLGSDQLIW